jgi:hypothetical protein
MSHANPRRDNETQNASRRRRTILVLERLLPDHDLHARVLALAVRVRFSLRVVSEPKGLNDVA